jgi:hypothetical protein
VKTRPSIEKRRKEMLRQERNRAKADRRKTRRDERGKEPELDEFGNEIVPSNVEAPAESEPRSIAALNHPGLSHSATPAERGEEKALEPAAFGGVKARP